MSRLATDGNILHWQAELGALCSILRPNCKAEGPDDEAHEMEEVQEDAAKEREENGGYQ